MLYRLILNYSKMTQWRENAGIFNRDTQPNYNASTEAYGLSLVLGAGVHSVSFSFRQIRYFVAVSEIGSISAAAQNLAVAQSTITEAIKELEADLGVILLERHARGMALTHNGHTFLRYANKILEEVSSAQVAFAEKVSVNGNLNIGVTAIVAGYALPDLLARYRRAHSGTVVRVLEDSPEYLEHYLLNGELDAAVLILSALKEPNALHTKVIQSSSFRVWLPVGHRLAKIPEIHPEALLNDRIILLNTDEMRTATAELWRHTTRQPPNVMPTLSVEAVRSLVATGFGLAVMPDLAYRPWSLEGDKVVGVKLAYPLAPVEIGVAWRRGSEPTEAIKAFIDLALTGATQKHR